MAKRLVKRNYDIHGYDISEQATEKLESAGGTILNSPTQVARQCDIIITSLPTTKAIESVYFGDDGIISGIQPESTCLEMSTVHPRVDKKISDELENVGAHYADAPVSGGPENCLDGSLTILFGGSRRTYELESTESILSSLGSKIYYVGASGAGHMTKLINNVMSMGNLVLAMEAVTLGVQNGVDGKILLEILANAGAGSNAFEKRMPRVLNRNFEAGFSIDLAKKDLGIALDTAATTNQPMLVSSVIHQLYQKGSSMGLGNADVGAIVKLFEETGNVRVEADEEISEEFDSY